MRCTVMNTNSVMSSPSANAPQPARPCEGSPDCIRQMDVAQTEERSCHIFSDRCCRSAAAESSLLSDKGHHTPLSDYLALLRQARLLK